MAETKGKIDRLWELQDACRAHFRSYLEQKAAEEASSFVNKYAAFVNLVMFFVFVAFVVHPTQLGFLTVIWAWLLFYVFPGTHFFQNRPTDKTREIFNDAESCIIAYGRTHDMLDPDKKQAVLASADLEACRLFSAAMQVPFLREYLTEHWCEAVPPDN